jgi:predicted Zn finger-like uncharacterized protein
VGIELAVEVHCERCGTSYSFEESRLGEDGARVRCARCGHVFLVPKASAAPAGLGPSRPPPPDALRREWRVRRRDGSVSVLRELTTLQRWIVEGTLGREDEIGLDGETWRVLGTIPDLGPFFAGADARAQVAVLEGELARLRAKPLPLASAPPVPAPETPPGPPPARSGSSFTPAQRPLTGAAPALSASSLPQGREEPALGRRPSPSPRLPEPAFTRTAAGLGVAATDEWEPPKLSRGVGPWVVVVVLLLLLASAATAGYFYVWLPERQRAQDEQTRNGQLEQAQSEHQAQVRAAEQRAKEELLQSLAAANAKDAGPTLPPDAGPPPRGSLEAPAAPTPPPVAAAEARVPSSTLSAPSNARGREPAAGVPSGNAEARPLALPGGLQTFEDWMAEAERRRTHERASSALAAYDRALALQPERSDAHAGRGLTLRDLGRRPEALSEFQRALELDPRDGVAVLGLAETYRSLGRTEEARAAYQRYLEGWPGGPDAQAARAALDSLKE